MRCTTHLIPTTDCLSCNVVALQRTVDALAAIPRAPAEDVLTSLRQQVSNLAAVVSVLYVSNAGLRLTALESRLTELERQALHVRDAAVERPVFPSYGPAGYSMRCPKEGK